MYEDDSLPKYDCSDQAVCKEWATKATDEQIAMIVGGKDLISENRDSYLPNTYDEELGTTVEHLVCRRGEFPSSQL